MTTAQKRKYRTFIFFLNKLHQQKISLSARMARLLRFPLNNQNPVHFLRICNFEFKTGNER